MEEYLILISFLAIFLLFMIFIYLNIKINDLNERIDNLAEILWSNSYEEK